MLGVALFGYINWFYSPALYILNLLLGVCFWVVCPSAEKALDSSSDIDVNTPLEFYYHLFFVIHSLIEDFDIHYMSNKIAMTESATGAAGLGF